MLLGFKTQIIVKNSIGQLLAKHAGVARHAWNWGLGLTKAILDHNIANPDDKIKFPSAIDLHKWLVALVKSKHPWYYEVSKTAPQYALMHLREAWKKCFQHQAGAPKFKKKGRRDSFTLEGKIKIISPNQIQVPVIGVLKTYEILPIGITPKTVTISRKADKWFISFLLEVEPQCTPKAIDIVGVDLGILNPATLSTGEVFPGAKKTRQLLKKLAHNQWIHRHKQPGSKNCISSGIKIARLHLKIANIRRDYLHKLTTYLAKNHGLVVIEDLNVSGMLANGKLALAIADGSFYEFKRQLEYKCQLYSSSLLVVSRWFPSSKTCHCCGEVKQSLSLSQRIFHCEKCGWQGDRDLNAALNLERVGRATPEFTPADKKEPTPLVEAGSQADTSLIGRFE
ncbi:RNA-guided endonuclease InsQ/TnpB family protein [Microseira wollei]|uniref:IS605 family transposase OrfB n=1 Tax=Microseira wollei NIES-4236 TaxID=2530354 RepID=A0AAV3XTG9_9CYAN|nr:transposase [Microseira wollei]GET44606.1 IS605 family transposase OrfB [Microseira wollei NIES-4236]